MSPLTGLVATAIAFTLAVALGLAAHDWNQRQARYLARIAELTDAADRTQASLRTELASCRAAVEAPRVVVAQAPPTGAQTPAGARRLLTHQPEGIDACARMESADRAVLSNLK